MSNFLPVEILPELGFLRCVECEGILLWSFASSYTCMEDRKKSYMENVSKLVKLVLYVRKVSTPALHYLPKARRAQRV